MMPCYTHNHQQECPDDDTGVRAAEKEGKDEEYCNKQHASNGNIPEQRNHSDCQRNTDQSGDGETVEHDSTCGGHAFSAAEVKKDRPVVTDYTEKTSQQ